MVKLSNNFFKKGFSFKPQVTSGICPFCEENTMLVSMTPEFYRCMSCGSDLEQKINGVIKYIPTIMIQNEETKLDGKEI